MQRKTLIAALLVVMVAALAACGRSGEDTSSSGSAPEVVVTTPAPTQGVERVVFAATRPPQTLNPYQAVDQAELSAVTNLCEPLMRLAPNLDVVPGLAKTVTHPNPLTYVYTLRDDVHFWDGRPLTAEDVAYSLMRNLDPATASLWGAYFDRVKSITATGPLKVTVQLTKPDVVFPELMAGHTGIIGEKAFMERAGAAYGTPKTGVMCTGPYMVGSWKQAEGITLKANPGYWDAARKPLAKRVELRPIENPSTRISALVAGDADGIYGGFYDGLDQLERGGTGTVYQGPGSTVMTIMGTEKPGPMRDARVRNALAKAIDYAGLVKTVYKDTAVPARALATPGTWSYARDTYQAAWNALPEPKLDLAGARADVERIGATAKRTIVMASTADISPFPQLAGVIQDGARRAGLHVEIRNLSPSAYIQAAFDPKARGKFDALLVKQFPDYPDPLMMYGMMALPGGIQNFSGYANPRVTKLLTQARETEDAQARAQLVAQAQRIITAEKPWIPLIAPSNLLFMNHRITGAPAGSVFLDSAWAAALGASK